MKPLTKDRLAKLLESVRYNGGARLGIIQGHIAADGRLADVPRGFVPANLRKIWDVVSGFGGAA